MAGLSGLFGGFGQGGFGNPYGGFGGFGGGYGQGAGGYGGYGGMYQQLNQLYQSMFQPEGYNIGGPAGVGQGGPGGYFPVGQGQGQGQGYPIPFNPKQGMPMSPGQQAMSRLGNQPAGGWQTDLSGNPMPGVPWMGPSLMAPGGSAGGAQPLFGGGGQGGGQGFGLLTPSNPMPQLPKNRPQGAPPGPVGIL